MTGMVVNLSLSSARLHDPLNPANKFNSDVPFAPLNGGT
ncbi:MAG: hypothetical protein OJF51_000188 [Nitrospira sp.]|jgi:hypothetical protein|nr:MAG: hypothetical protein OJF51_000188 [Nitrospira sp.]